MTFTKQITCLLKEAGFSGIANIKSLAGGKNNQVFCIEADGKQFLLKSYFWHPADRRERLKSEFLFSSFLWKKGIRNIPCPLAKDSEHQLGLYDFVHGRKFSCDDVTESAVQESLNFFLAINHHREDAEAKTLPEASEVCFSLQEHLQLIEHRLDRFKEIKEEKAIDMQARDFVFHKLVPAWEKIRRDILKAGEIQSEERCLSPSDFGFHNALLAPEGTIYFHDFEYAGWDDPSRMICDFFCQPEFPVSLSFFDYFSKEVFGFLKNPMGLKKTRLLLPAYQIKWCCIMLNEFLSEGNDRRKFAHKEENTRVKADQQLTKAKIYFEKYL